MDNEQKRAELRQKRANLREIYAKIEKSSSLVEMRSLDDQAAKLRAEVYNIEDSLDGADPEVRSPGPIGATAILGTYGVTAAGGVNERSGNVMPTKETIEKYEQRGAYLKEGRQVVFEPDEIELRTVVAGGGNILMPTHDSRILAPAFPEVSATIDLVNAVSLPGGEAYRKGYVISYGEGDYTGETEEMKEAEPVFGHVSTGKSYLSSYGEISSQAIKLPNANYQAEVAKAIRVALRKKVSKQIIAGTGGDNALTGIFHGPSDTVADAPFGEIDENTLDELCFNYGGDESVEEGGVWLIVSKKTLADFAALRSSDGATRLYRIKLDPSGMTGSISSEQSFEVRFVINSACPSFAAVSNGNIFGVYGRLKAYELPIFSPIVVEKSSEHKFRENITAFRGELYCGGVPAGYKAFTLLKKAPMV